MDENKVLSTLEDIEEEIKGNSLFKQNIEEAYEEDRLDEFLKSVHCDASISDISSFLSSIKDKGEDLVSNGEEIVDTISDIKETGENAVSLIRRIIEWIKGIFKK